MWQVHFSLEVGVQDQDLDLAASAKPELPTVVLGPNPKNRFRMEKVAGSSWKLACFPVSSIAEWSLDSEILVSLSYVDER